ncbi:MAG: DivIVA domain-containing protein [Bacillota bacterium]|jgi:cell division septum initiation protein DivIVA
MNIYFVRGANTMKLTKEGISQIRLTYIKKKYYLTQEVDKCLDDIAEAADDVQKELADLREKVAKNMENEAELSSILVNAQKNAQQILQNAEQNAEETIKKAQDKAADILEEAKKQSQSLTAANQKMHDKTYQLKESLKQYVEDLENKFTAVLSNDNIKETNTGENDSVFKDALKRLEGFGKK